MILEYVVANHIICEMYHEQSREDIVFQDRQLEVLLDRRKVTLRVRQPPPYQVSLLIGRSEGIKKRTIVSVT